MKTSYTVNPLRVTKRMVFVHLFLNDGIQIKGFLHLGPRIRFTDTLNFKPTEKPFLPVSDALMICKDGSEKTIPFMLVNRFNIASCVPRERPA